MLFDVRTGPDLGSEAPTYPAHPVPDWYRDAKLGIFIHWGLYSIPAFGQPRDPAAPADGRLAWVNHPYAEWYANTIRIAESPAARYHQRTYGTGTTYEDLADRWECPQFDPSGWMRLFASCGARYVVPTTKHHDGFCLWDTPTTSFNAARRRPRRDLVGEMHDAARAAGLRFGVYFSGALDWHVSDLPPITSDTELFTHRRNDKAFARYAAAQLTELIERFRPDYLWNDIDWPDAGKGGGDGALAALFSRYYAAFPDGVVNDRWGVPHLGVRTREYLTEESVVQAPWEACRGIGDSFGYNAVENDEHLLTGRRLVHLFVDTIAKNGNLLLNVGPRGDGSLPDAQVQRLRALGDWIDRNRDAVYGSRPAPLSLPERLRATTRNGAVYLIDLHPERGAFEVPSPLRGQLAGARWLGPATAPQPAGDSLEPPDAVRDQPAATLEIRGIFR